MLQPRHATGRPRDSYARLALAATAAFALLAIIVQSGGLYAVDRGVVLWAADHRTPWVDEFMVQVTTLGDGVVVVMLALVAALFLWPGTHRNYAILLLVAVPGGQVVNNVLKLLFGRERPDVATLHAVFTTSFPSGHAMAAVVAYGALAFVLARLEPAPPLRRATWTAAVLLILLIGASRTYLGVHYPSDVLAGYAAGLAWLALSAAATRAIARRRTHP